MYRPPRSMKAALAELVRLAGPEATAALLVKLLESRSELVKHLHARYFRGRSAPSERLVERLLEAIGTGAHQITPVGELVDRRLEPGIAIYGMFTAEIGIGQSARRSALSLATTDVRTSRHNVIVPLFENAVDFDVRPDLNSDLDTALIHLNPDTLLEHLPRFPPSLLLGPRRIGFWHWELPVFPARWAKAFDHVDEVWVPSAFVADGIKAASDIPVRVVPHAAPSLDISQEQARRAFDLPSSAFVFLTIFDSNSFPARKNPLGVVRAFRDAFPNQADRDHVLVVKCHGRGRRDTAFQEVLELAGVDPRIVFIDEAFSEQRMRLLQAACNAYVSLHRSEGYGLNLLECMALGKLAIGTGFSGNLTFMNPTNSVLVPYSARLVSPHEYLYGERQWWAEPDHDAAVDALRWASAGGTEAEARAARGMAEARLDFSFEAIGRLSVAAWLGQTKPH